MRRTSSKVLGCALAVAVLGGGCTSGKKSASDTTTTVKYDVAHGVESPAAALRADLTDILQENVLLIGITTDAQLAGGATDPARAVLDQNAEALGAVLTGFYGQPTGADFVSAWKRYTAGLVAFASVAGSTDKAAVDGAKAGISAVQSEVTTLLNTANPQLTPVALKATLTTYATGVEGAITAQARKDPAAGAKLKAAADAMTSTAIILAAGIVKQKPKDVAGKLDAVSAVVRTSLASKLSEHAYLAGIVTGTTLSGGDARPATAALDANSEELSQAIGAVYGDAAAAQFLKLWRQHIGLFVTFTKAAGAGDSAGMAAARSALDAYSGTLAAFLNGANPNLAKATVAQDLADHIDSLLTTIEAQAARDPGQVNKLREAAMHMPGTALLLATGIAQQFPNKFG